MKSFTAVLIWLLLFNSGCSWTRIEAEKENPVSGRELVLQALKPAKVIGGAVSQSGIAATLLSSSKINSFPPMKGLDPNGSHGGRPLNMVLRDGTKVGGLMFEYDDGSDNAKPLLMVSFGLFQDRWGTEAAKFYELYLRDPKEKIPCHVLILDHPSAGPFMANNGNLSMGAYDDGRMWIEVARQLRAAMNLAGIHLLGVSMSGQTVVHALIEDKRLGLDLFQSGLVFSIAPDFREAPGKQFSMLPTPEGVENPWKSGLTTAPDDSQLDEIQGWGVWLFLQWQFLPHYQAEHPAGEHLEIRKEDAAVFLRTAFEERLVFLSRQKVNNWNHEDFSFANLDAYMASTRIAEIVDRVKTPLVMVSSRDDPAVEHATFEEVKLAAMDNPWIAVYETNDGGHFGFDLVYGKGYLGRIIRLMLDPKVYLNWDVSPR